MQQSISMSPARLLWIGFSGNETCVHQEVLNRIRGRALIEFVSIVGSLSQVDGQKLVDEVLSDEHEAMFARYDSSVFAASGLVDSEIYGFFQEFEGETLRMMDRLRGRGPKYRYRDSYEFRRRLFLDQCSYWYEYLNSRKISHIVFIAVPHQVFDFVLYKLALKLCIPVIICAPEKAGYTRKIEQIKWVKKHKSSINSSTFFISETISDIGIWNLSSRIKSIANEKSLSLVNGDFLPEEFSISSRDGAESVKKPKRFDPVKTSWQSFMRIPKRPFEIREFLGDSFVSYLQYVRHLKVKKLSSKNKNCLLYTLPYQPEESTSPRAGIFVEQRLAINMISQAIPSDWKIRVREHPDQYGRRRPRSRNFWKEITTIPKVEIVPLAESVKDSMTSALAVGGPPGTMCIQAWLLGIPVILFGDMFLKKAPGVFSITNGLDLRRAMQIIASGLKTDSSEIQKFRNWVNFHSFAGSVAHSLPVDAGLREVSILNIENILTSWLSIEFEKLK